KSPPPSAGRTPAATTRPESSGHPTPPARPPRTAAECAAAAPAGSPAGRRTAPPCARFRPVRRWRSCRSLLVVPVQDFGEVRRTHPPKQVSGEIRFFPHEERAPADVTEKSAPPVQRLPLRVRTPSLPQHLHAGLGKLLHR